MKSVFMGSDEDKLKAYSLLRDHLWNDITRDYKKKSRAGAKIVLSSRKRKELAIIYKYLYEA